MKFFVGGTDTGVGKTTMCAALLRVLPTSYRYWKPVQTGDDDDTETVRRLSEVAAQRFFRPGYQFPTPVSPHLAAKLAGETIQAARLTLPDEPDLVVEGAGGLLVPYHDSLLQLDWVKDRELSLLLVAEDRVGAINQVLLSVEACEKRHVRVLGVILNKGRAEVGNQATLQKWTGLPVWKVPADVNPADSLKASGIELHLGDNRL